METIFYGRGGQGAVTSATLLVKAAMKEGYHGQGFPFFGAERRGAPVMAFARISDKPILRHGMFVETDVLVVLDPMLVETGQARKIKVREKGTIILNIPEQASPKKSDFNAGSGVRVYTVNATRIALENNLVVAGWPVVNTSVLGAFSKATQIISLNSILESIKEYFPGELGEKNARSAERAYRETREVSFFG